MEKKKQPSLGSYDTKLGFYPYSLSRFSGHVFYIVLGCGFNKFSYPSNCSTNIRITL